MLKQSYLWSTWVHVELLWCQFVHGLGVCKSNQVYVKTIWVKIVVWVTCHGLVQFLCYTSNSTVLQVDVSVLFLRRKEFVGMIANYNDLQTFRHWISEMKGWDTWVREWLKPQGQGGDVIRMFLRIMIFGKIVDYKGK